MALSVTSQTALVSSTVRRQIMTGEVAPGQRLVEAELSENLGVGRGAVRAALVDLAHEGLVERIANRGARVRVVPLEEALAITEVRMAVEGLCAAKAAENVDDEQVAALRDLALQMTQAVEQGDLLLYSHLNQQLHDLVIAVAAQPVAAEVLARLRARNVRHQFRLAFRPGRPHESLPQHLAIVDGICRREPDAAEAAMRAHLASVLVALAASSSAPVGEQYAGPPAG